MNKNDQEELDILRKLNDKNSTSQREIAEDMGISLGKLNYCLKALKKKGLIKYKNFKNNKNKKNYLICHNKKKKGPYTFSRIPKIEPQRLVIFSINFVT